MAMRGVLLVSLAALLLAGCWGSDPNSVPLLADAEMPPTCYLWYGQGELIEDGRTGTAVKESSGHIITLNWPKGYTARRSGANIEVLDTVGQVVAVTGRRYRFNTSFWSGSSGPADAGCVSEISSFSE